MIRLLNLEFTALETKYNSLSLIRFASLIATVCPTTHTLSQPHLLLIRSDMFTHGTRSDLQ